MITSNTVLAILLSKQQTINNTVQMLVINYHLPTSSPTHKVTSHSALGMKRCNHAECPNMVRDDSVVSSPSVAIIKSCCRRLSASLEASYVFRNWPHVRVDTLPCSFNAEWRWRVLWIHEHTGRDTWGRRFACRMPRVTSQGTSVVHPSTPGTRWQNELFPLHCRFLPYDLPHCLLGRVY